MLALKQAQKALYNIWKETRISDYKTKIKPQMDIINDYFDKECEWTPDDEFEHSYYISSCGFNFEFSDDRNCPNEHDFTFCPKCGGKIKESEC